MRSLHAFLLRWMLPIAIGFFLIWVGLVSLLATADDEATPFLRVTTPRDSYETGDRVEVLLESKVWTLDPLTGNVTLAANTGIVTLTVFDRRHDVLLREVEIPMFQGNGSYVLNVDPIWSSALIELYARDEANAVSGLATFRTQYSTEYLMYLLHDVWMADDAAEDARQEAQRNGDVGAAWATSTAFAVVVCTMMFLLFLRVDQERADEFGVESWKERGLRRLHWPPSFVPDDAGLAFDPERAARTGFDVEVASQVAKEIRRIQVMRLKEIRAEIDDAIEGHLAPPADEDLDVLGVPTEG